MVIEQVLISETANAHTRGLGLGISALTRSSSAPMKCFGFSDWINGRAYRRATIFGSESTPRIAIG